jgi:hypothetical protein
MLEPAVRRKGVKLRADNELDPNSSAHEKSAKRQRVPQAVRGEGYEFPGGKELADRKLKVGLRGRQTLIAGRGVERRQTTPVDDTAGDPEVPPDLGDAADPKLDGDLSLLDHARGRHDTFGPVDRPPNDRICEDSGAHQRSTAARRHETPAFQCFEVTVFLGRQLEIAIRLKVQEYAVAGTSAVMDMGG